MEETLRCIFADPETKKITIEKKTLKDTDEERKDFKHFTEYVRHHIIITVQKKMQQNIQAVCLTDIEFKSLSTVEKSNEKLGQYIKDGLYNVGEHGAMCDHGFVDLIKVMDIEADEDEDDYLAPNSIPGGSIIQVNLLEPEYLLKDSTISELVEDVYEVEIIEIGRDDIPFDTSPIETDTKYYASDHMLFGSLNVKLKQ